MAPPRELESHPGGEQRELTRGARIHGALDLGFAALYAWVGLWLTPSRDPRFTTALVVVVALLAAAGFSLLARRKRARAIALVAHGTLLIFCLAVITLLVASAAYLRGVYGPLGQGMAAVTLVVVALVVEGCGLLPLFQIRWLSRPAVRRFLAGDGAREDGASS